MTDSVKNTVLCKKDSVDLGQQLLDHFKKLFLKTSDRNKKILLLTLLPEEWGVSLINQHFPAPEYMIRQAKKLVQEVGVMTTPSGKSNGRALSEDTKKLVGAFYEGDDISRVLPGKNDCVPIRDSEGNKFYASKRLMLRNLREVYAFFKEKHPVVKLGFSKFSELRRKYCVLAGPKGTHSVCVCTYHQNVKLMIENSKIPSLTDGKIKHYRDCFAKVMCNPPNVSCFQRKCEVCPGKGEVEKILESAFENHDVHEISYNQWLNVDRCNLETLKKSRSDFVESFGEKLDELLLHDFNSKVQSAYFNHLKETLKPGELLISLDFAKNY